MYLNEGFKSNVFKLFILIKIATIKSNNVNTQDKIPSISDISRISDISGISSISNISSISDKSSISDI